MATSYVYKSFTAGPQRGWRLDKKNLIPIDLTALHRLLESDVRFITELTQWTIDSDIQLRRDVEQSTDTFPTAVGRRLGISIDKAILGAQFSGKAGLSRYSFLLQDRVVREVRSWNSRSAVAEGNSHRYISQGWKRTAHAGKPADLSLKYSLSAVDKGFAEILGNPWDTGTVGLKMVIDGQWYLMEFEFDRKRFQGAQKICLPDVTIHDGKAIFSFAVAYVYEYADISPRYVVGVDVGVRNFATAAVWDTETHSVVHGYSMSRRARSLHNSIRATSQQVRHLREKTRFEEAAAHRAANIRKKRELAILVAQEIAELAYIWDNALICVEDLSWISHTMSSGRWNRGELVKWVTSYHELNGGRVVSVNAYNTSQRCHVCDSRVTHPTWDISQCSHCNATTDRDLNAAVNIARVSVDKGTHGKIVSTRRKARKYAPRVSKRTPVTRETLTFPGRDRSKSGPTPRRPSKPSRRRTQLPDIKEVTNSLCSPTCNDDATVVGDGVEKNPTFRTLEKQHDLILTSVTPLRV